jgi:hypothetical protein
MSKSQLESRPARQKVTAPPMGGVVETSQEQLPGNADAPDKFFLNFPSAISLLRSERLMDKRLF